MEQNGRHAIIDVGSNTIHLLVGEVEEGRVLPVTGEKFAVRLGSGVDKTGRIEDARLPVAVEAISFFATVADFNGAPEPTILATSAVRDAENGLDLVREVRERTGLVMRLISGEEEAALGFRGAVSALGDEVSAGGPVFVVDLGGGSAQLILGDVAGGPEKQVSLPLGSNRTTERFAESDPPRQKELKALRKAVSEMLPEWKLPKGTAIVAVGGSARAMLRLTRDKLTQKRLRRLAEETSQMPSGVFARETGLVPERARVLPAAASTLEAILAYYGRPSLTVARGGIREGVILALADGEANGNGR